MDPKTKKQVLFLLYQYSALKISYFSVKKIQNAPFLRANFFSSQNRSIWMSTYPEFYADFKSEGIFKKNALKKITLKK